MQSSSIAVIDIRVASLVAAELKIHSGAVNSIAWSPHSSNHLASGGDDAYLLLWDTSSLPRPVTDPVASLSLDAEVNQVAWSVLHPGYLGLAFSSLLQVFPI